MNLIRHSTSNKGFTLIELLVVIAIIGTLSSIVIASLNQARERARVAKAQQEVRTLYNAILRYNIDNDAWPTNDNITATITWNGAWKTGYIDVSIPDDPRGHSYFFDGIPSSLTECGAGQTSLCSAGKNAVFESFNRPDMTAQGDDICIYFEPKC